MIPWDGQGGAAVLGGPFRHVQLQGWWGTSRSAPGGGGWLRWQQGQELLLLLRRSPGRGSMGRWPQFQQMLLKGHRLPAAGPRARGAWGQREPGLGRVLQGPRGAALLAPHRVGQRVPAAGGSSWHRGGRGGAGVPRVALGSWFCTGQREGGACWPRPVFSPHPSAASCPGWAFPRRAPGSWGCSPRCSGSLLPGRCRSRAAGTWGAAMGGREGARGTAKTSFSEREGWAVLRSRRWQGPCPVPEHIPGACWSSPRCRHCLAPLRAPGRVIPALRAGLCWGAGAARGGSGRGPVCLWGACSRLGLWPSCPSAAPRALQLLSGAHWGGSPLISARCLSPAAALGGKPLPFSALRL